MIWRGMKIERHKTAEGFTLVEILFSTFTSLLVFAAIHMIFLSEQSSSIAIESKGVAQQDARAFWDAMAMEIGMASYNETFNANIWPGPGPQNYKGIQQVSDANGNPLGMDLAVTVQMDINRSQNVGDAPNAMITYMYDAANQRLARETNDGQGPQRFLGDIPGNPRSPRVINNMLVPSIPIF